MLRIPRIIMIFVLLMPLPPTAVSAEDFDPAVAIGEMAARSAAISNIQTIGRICESMTFWQSVALLGTARRWTFVYSLGGNDRAPWTLRLSNFLGESENEVIQAKKALSRTGAFDETQASALDGLYAKERELRDLSGEVHRLLMQDRVEEAASLYRDMTIPLNRDIGVAVYSITNALNSSISNTALKARVALK